MHKSLEQRRAEFRALLAEGSCAKLQYCQTGKAFDLVKRAYVLAKEEPRLPRPLPQLAAYRYAHLLLRSNPNTEIELTRIDELFVEAAQATSLTVLPSLYRLAVLGRLRRLGAGVAESFVQKRFAGCQKAVCEHLACPDSTRDQFRLQHGLVNMLELAAYFLELPAVQLEGITDDESEPSWHWHLVGPDPTIATVRFAGEFILEELDARRENNPQALTFCLPLEGTAWWREPGDGTRHPLGENTAQLLAALLGRVRLSQNRLCVRALGDNMLPAAVRQARRRFRLDLAEMTGRPETDFGGTAPGDISVPTDLVILGAVADRRLPRASG